MIPVKTGAVAVLDMLGAKGIWARKESNRIIENWEDIVSGFTYLSKKLNKDKKILTPGGFKSTVNAFSDTIIVTYEGKDPLLLLEYLGYHTMLPFCDSILNGVYLRGAIGIGKFYRSSSMIIGPAIDEAVSWYQSADWMGVMLSPSASYTFDKEKSTGYISKWYEKYEIPFKDNIKRNFWALKWPAYMKEILELHEDKRDPHIALMDSFSSSFIDSSSLSKYNNTIDFFDNVIKTGSSSTT